MVKFSYKLKYRFLYLLIPLISFFFLLFQPIYGFKAEEDYKIYEPDYSRKHLKIDWKHEGGSVFSTNSRQFYATQGVRCVPCQTYQELFNTRQLATDAASIFIPWFGLAKDVSDIAGTTDSFINS